MHAGRTYLSIKPLETDSHAVQKIEIALQCLVTERGSIL